MRASRIAEQRVEALTANKNTMSTMSPFYGACGIICRKSKREAKHELEMWYFRQLVDAMKQYQKHKNKSQDKISAEKHHVDLRDVTIHGVTYKDVFFGYKTTVNVTPIKPPARKVIPCPDPLGIPK